ncbi:hypothetical protein [Serratia symbiotica]|uniref:Uncharacterized protein n=3 Tax=Serratia symbiotica TaxID=138074 RepID=A0A455VQV2_9GAMM|nr:hypothetical protein [Serratia symbiotica]BBI93046.1 uncharacterized protein SSYIS1_40460 [Serratia symbiotica]
MYTFLTLIIIYAFLFIVTMMEKRKDKIEISIIRDNEEVAIKNIPRHELFSIYHRALRSWRVFHIFSYMVKEFLISLQHVIFMTPKLIVITLTCYFIYEPSAIRELNVDVITSFFESLKENIDSLIILMANLSFFICFLRMVNPYRDNVFSLIQQQTDEAIKKHIGVSEDCRIIYQIAKKKKSNHYYL